jgi:hypothetical protein
MTPDPRWLEILKASGWQTLAIAAACSAFLLIGRWGWLPTLDPWMILAATFGLLLTGFLALASFISATFQFFPMSAWIVQWGRIRRAKRELRDYIPYMIERERMIIAYLLSQNQKTFLAEADGGYASTLMSRGFIKIIAKPGQQVDITNVPMGIPDHFWNVLVKHKDKFPYTPSKDKEIPWRAPQW